MKKPRNTLDNLPYDETVVALVELFRPKKDSRTMLSEYRVTMQHVADLRRTASEIATVAGTRLREQVTRKWSAQKISDAITNAHY
jgi:hypothetical protein